MMDTDAEEIVFTSGTNSGNSNQHYHTDRDCKNLRQANNVNEYPRSHVEDRRELCSECAGEIEGRGEQDMTAYRTLSEADPEEFFNE